MGILIDIVLIVGFLSFCALMTGYMLHIPAAAQGVKALVVVAAVGVVFIAAVALIAWQPEIFLPAMKYIGISGGVICLGFALVNAFRGGW